MIAEQRIYWTADRTRLVYEGDPDAAELYAAPGDPVAEEQQPLLVAQTKERPRPQRK